MTAVPARVRAAVWWLVPLAVLAALIGWEIDWGKAVHLRPPPAEAIAPKPVSAGLLPNYVIAGGIAARAETVNRTLFNPTRRPAPVAVAEAAKPRIQRGLYALTGTTLADNRNLAFLKEVNGGKSRTVKQGDQINGMLVAEVRPDRVKLTLGDESEEIVLRVATNPKPTPQAAAAGAAPPGQAVQAAAPAQAVAARPQDAAAQAGAAQSLAERRRAARAAEGAARQAAAPSAPAASPADGAASGVPGTGGAPAGPTWEFGSRRQSPPAATSK